MTEMSSAIALLVGGFVGPIALPSTMPHINAVSIGALVGFLCFIGIWLIWLVVADQRGDAATDY